jgi:hypothetical protein
MIRYTLIIGFLLGLVTTTVIYIVQVFIFNHSFDVINCIISFILSWGLVFCMAMTRTHIIKIIRVVQ